MFVRNGEKLGSVLVDADPSEAEPETQPASDYPEPEPVPELVEEPAVVEPEPEPESVPEPPRHADPKADWVAFAVEGAEESKRVSREEAEDMTKAELIEMFGD